MCVCVHVCLCVCIFCSITQSCLTLWLYVCICCSITQSCLTLWPHGLQHARLPCPSPIPRACSNSCPLSWWCHPVILLSVISFFSCLQSFPASGFFPNDLALCIRRPKYWSLQLPHKSFQWCVWYIYAYVCARLLQLWPPLCDFMDCSLLGKNTGVGCHASSRGWPRDGTCISYVSCIRRWVLYH